MVVIVIVARLICSERLQLQPLPQTRNLPSPHEQHACGVLLIGAERGVGRAATSAGSGLTGDAVAGRADGAVVVVGARFGTVG